MLTKNSQPPSLAPELRILLLDDNPAELVTIERTLEDIQDHTYQTHNFRSIRLAIDYLFLHQNEINLCLIDYSLGNETAFDFIRECTLKQIRPIPIVVMTNQPEERIDEALMLAGVHDYWDKSQFNKETLSRCLRYAFHRHKSLLNKEQESDNKSHQIARIDHDFRAPVNGITGYTQILKRLWSKQGKDLTAREQQCIEGIEECANMLTNLINGLVEASPIEHLQPYFNPEEFDLIPLARDLVSRHKVRAAERRLTLDLTANRPELIVYADAHRLHNVLNIILTNAIKYTNFGSVKLSISAYQKDDIDWIELIVEDTGIGIAPENITHLFDAPEPPFTDEHALSNELLGLPAAKQWVESHHGAICVSSTLGEGSQISVHIPQIYQFDLPD